MAILTGCTRNVFQSIRLLSTARQKIRKPPPKVVNCAQLIGTVSTDVFTTPRKDKYFYLSTTYKNDEKKKNAYDIHRIIVPAYSLDRLSQPIQKNDKLLINGAIRPTTFSMHTGKKGNNVYIAAKQIYQCHKDDDISDDDQNHVEIEASIWNDVTYLDELTYFHVNISYLLNETQLGSFEEKRSTMPIFIRDDFLRASIHNKLKRLDKVRIEGFLANSRCMDSDGNKRYSTRIEATRVTKLINLSQHQSQNVELISN